MAQGPPEAIAATEGSWTGRFLRGETAAAGAVPVS
jgi:hypothetical protein